MKTLLEKAKNVSPKSIKIKMNDFDEELEIALAWLNNEITTRQYFEAINGKPKKSSYGGSILYRVATILKVAITKNKIIIKKK